MDPKRWYESAENKKVDNYSMHNSPLEIHNLQYWPILKYALSHRVQVRKLSRDNCTDFTSITATRLWLPSIENLPPVCVTLNKKTPCMIFKLEINTVSANFEICPSQLSSSKKLGKRQLHRLHIHHIHPSVTPLHRESPSCVCDTQ